MALLATVLTITLGATSADSGSNHFDPGYCTWDAAEQAHATWGIFPPWYGDAGDWAQGALNSGWQVSSRPEPNTIIVLPRGIQGSGSLGHVAWVLGVEDDGTTVDVRSMNWSGRGRITVHQLQADGNAQFLAPPTDARLIDDVGPAIGYTLQGRRGVEQW